MHWYMKNRLQNSEIQSRSNSYTLFFQYSVHQNRRIIKHSQSIFFTACNFKKLSKTFTTYDSLLPLAAVKVYLKGSNKFESWEEIQFTEFFFFIGCLFSSDPIRWKHVARTSNLALKSYFKNKPHPSPAKIIVHRE